jgi:hypothetical protein
LVAIGPDGEATAVWTVRAADGFMLVSAQVAGTRLAAPVPLSPASHYFDLLRLVAGPGGEAIALWNDASGRFAAVRARGAGAFGAAESVAGDGSELAIDPAGRFAILLGDGTSGPTLALRQL